MIKEIPFNRKYNTPVVLCLGRFESLHVGHKTVFSAALSMAKRLDAEVMVMSFDTDSLRFTGVILNYDERKAMLEALGVSLLLVVPFTEEFRRLSKEQFLSGLKDNLNIKGVCCGYDFRFGYNRSGSDRDIKDFFKNTAEVNVTDKVEFLGDKISSTRIKNALANGEVALASEMLGYNYFFEGVVEQGRAEGRKLGFPTANVPFPSGKFMPRVGVYIARVSVGGESYPAITNIGAAPTFGVEKIITESHLLNFSKDIYGEKIKVEIVAFLRDIRRFSSKEELIETLNDNKRVTLEYFNDGEIND